LTAHVEDDEIAAHLNGADPRAVCQGLVALTLERGARDNVSVVAVFCEANTLTVRLDPAAARGYFTQT